MAGSTAPRDDEGVTERIRVLVVDDQALLRESFKRLLEVADASLEVAATAGDGAEAVAAVARLAAAGGAPLVVLMDVRMPRLNGVEATRQIVARWPAARIVILSTFDDEEYIVEGLRAGACGYLLKDASSEELVRAIRDAARGQSPIQPAVATKLVARLTRADLSPSPPPAGGPEESPPTAARPRGEEQADVASGSILTGREAQAAPLVEELTDREREILRHVAQGASNREIGEALFITEGTVKNHVSNILSKLGLRDRTQAALYARERGLA